MHLINTKDLTLKEFPQNQIPSYAILSHTWTDDEVSFEEFADPSSKLKLGYQKINRFCSKALRDGHEYVWVDTCCIDKRSSAELSEAINSMYKWYKRAKTCYVYLSDVPAQLKADVDYSAFISSRWFTRGWTLQELLAPKYVNFHTSDWKYIGSKNTLDNQISSITGIDTHILRDSKSIRSTSIAQKMSWASNRQTTREEDIAYCLMGLFDVNMPMLYGEGKRSFRRLQEEIMKVSNDQTIFVWEYEVEEEGYGGLLARSPRNFKHSGNFKDVSKLHQFESPTIVSTSQGISISAFISEERGTNEWNEIDEIHQTKGIFLAGLKCTEFNRPDMFASLQLSQVMSAKEEYVRIKGKELQRSRLRGDEQSLLVRHELPPLDSIVIEKEYMQILFSTNVRSNQIIAFTSPLSSLPKLTEHAAFEPSHMAGLGIVRIRDTPFFSSDPAEYSYGIPARPNKEALVLSIRLCDVNFVVSIGIDIMGQIGYDISCSNLFGDVDEKDYSTDSYEWSNGFESSLTATDLCNKSVKKACHVRLVIDQIKDSGKRESPKGSVAKKRIYSS